MGSRLPTRWRWLALAGISAAVGCSSFGSAPSPDAGADGSATDASTGPPDGGVTPGFVQATANKFRAPAAAQLPFQSSVTKGNAIVVAIVFEPATIAVSSITDSQDDAFTKVIAFDSTFESRRHYVWAAFNAKGGPTTLTVHCDSAVDGIEVYAHEYTNLTGFSGAEGANGKTSGTDGMLSPEVTTTTSTSLIFGFGVAGIATAGTGFAQRSAFNQNVTEDRVVTSTGLYEARATMPVSGGNWTMIAVAFNGH